MKPHHFFPILLSLAALLASCQKQPPFVAKMVDSSTTGQSKYPMALNHQMVRFYPALTKSGGGYFYDEVLEFRVWLHPEKGAKHLNGTGDYFASFAQFEVATAYSNATPGAEEPLVLIKQFEWIDEPQPKQFEVKHGERLTEWKCNWLTDAKRYPNSIKEFISKPKETRH